MKNILRFALVLVAAMTMNTSFAQTNLTQAVDFTATDTEGNTWTLFDVLAEGKYVVIDFFFVNWPTCPASIPLLNATYEHFGCGDYDVIILSISTGDTDAAVIAYDEQYGVLYPSISGVEGGGTAICNTYGINLYPTHIIIAPDGEIIEQDIWPVSSPADFIDPLEGAGCVANECDGGSTLTADFEADMVDPCLGSDVTFTNNSLGEITSYSWTFEGGDPATSEEENPVVNYTTPGEYDVTLVVSDGVDENTLLMEDYIMVGAIEASFEADNDDICDTEMVTFTSTTVCAEELTWTFEGGDPATSDEANPTVTYNTAGVYSVTLTAMNGDNELEVIEESYITVHNCTGVGSIALNHMRVSPNPGDGNFQIALPDNGIFEVLVFDITGHVVYTSNMTAAQNQLDISHLNNGVYVISANNGSTQFKERVIIK